MLLLPRRISASLKCMRTILLLILLEICQLSTFAQKAQSDETKAINRVRYAVVMVNAVGEHTRLGRLGTGFVVSSNGFVVTNKHVVDEVRTGESLLVGFRIPNQSTSANSAVNQNFLDSRAIVVDSDNENDLALLKTNIHSTANNPYLSNSNLKMAPLTPVKFSSTLPEEGVKVIVSGFPTKELKTVESQEGIVAGQTFRNLITNPPSRADLLLVAVPINRGNSGGPVYLASSGEVIGVAEGFIYAPVEGSPPLPNGEPQLNTNSGTGCVIPAKYVIALLHKNDVAN